MASGPKNRRKHKVMTNSKHPLPVAENILNRDFKADRMGQKIISDIIYIPTTKAGFTSPESLICVY